MLSVYPDTLKSSSWMAGKFSYNFAMLCDDIKTAIVAKIETAVPELASVCESEALTATPYWELGDGTPSLLPCMNNSISEVQMTDAVDEAEFMHSKHKSVLDASSLATLQHISKFLFYLL